MNTLVKEYAKYWWVVAIAALVVGAITTAAAQGFDIVKLELAWTVKRADAALDGFDRDAVKVSIYWDFLFLVLYAPALYLGTIWASEFFTSDRARRYGRWIGLGAVAAALFDIVENLAMLAYLNEFGSAVGWPLVAALTAIPKFTLAAIAIVFILVGSARAGIVWARTRTT